MPLLWRCVNGHTWPARADESTNANGSVIPCPKCGSSERTAVNEPQPPTGPPMPAWPGSQPGDPPPPRLAGFEILEMVGSGGMGVVYRARQLNPPRLVALKVIRQERLNHPDVVQRFRREAQAAARLSHPNVVAVYGSDLEGDTHYLALEYVPGVTLQNLVDNHGPLPIAQACDFVRQTALGLQHAAEMALVHRDIKPSNLMAVAPDGKVPSRAALKVLDMGVARLYALRDVEETLTTLTRDGSVIGTPDYIAPEQLENPHGADIRADLYSLGCTFYFLLTGRVPFPGGTLIQKLDRQRWETPPSVDQLRPEVPGAVAAVVRRLMAKHPDDRYRTPAELASALELLTRTGVLPKGHQPAALRQIAALTGHLGPVTGALFLSADQLVSAGDKSLRLWESGREVRRFATSTQEIGCLACLPGGAAVAAGQGVGVRLWEPSTGREILKLAGHSDSVRALAITPDGRILISGGDDRILRLWDLPGGRPLQRLVGHRGRISGVAFSPDGKLAASCDRDGGLKLWDLSNGREVRSFAVPRGALLGLAFTPDGTALLSAHFDTTLRLWDVLGGRELRRFSGHRQMVSAVAISPDGRTFASGSNDTTVRLWDPASGAELGCGQAHTGAVTCVLFSPDGKRVLSAGDTTLRLWEIP